MSASGVEGAWGVFVLLFGCLWVGILFFIIVKVIAYAATVPSHRRRLGAVDTEKLSEGERAQWVAYHHQVNQYRGRGLSRDQVEEVDEWLRRQHGEPG